MIKQQIQEMIKRSVAELGYHLDDIVCDISENPSFGDYSTNVALQLAKLKQIVGKQTSTEIAKELISHLRNLGDLSYLDKIEVAGNGFINFFVKPGVLAQDLEYILKTDKDFGKNDLGQGKKVQVEFISANPTGPLTLANGRGGALGDTLANVLIYSGYEVEREFYVNDTGNQVRLLGASIKAILGLTEPADNHYQGEYVKDLADKLFGSQAAKLDLARIDDLELGHMAADYLMEQEIKPAIERLGIKFDEFFSEKSLHQSDGLDKAIKLLSQHNLSYQQEGALWFKSTQFGDDKDRVLITSETETGISRPTYYLTDIAYHLQVFTEGFDKKINLWGADHHSYVVRLKAVMEALGYQDRLDILLMQMVKLYRNGQEVRMSKRAGNFVTLDELLDVVSADVARFFFLMYSPNSHINFDLDLATEQSEKNPVYFVQYAHARMANIIKKGISEQGLVNSQKGDQNLGLLTGKYEIDLIKHLLEFPDLVLAVAKSYQVNHLTTYVIALADLFHKFYEHCPVLTADSDSLIAARLGLVKSGMIVLSNTLDLMGVNAPERM